MWLTLLIAAIILGFALLIKQFEPSTREFAKPFLIIVALFFVLYIGATIFISYRINVYSAEQSNFNNTKTENVKIIDKNFESVDLRTAP